MGESEIVYTSDEILNKLDMNISKSKEILNSIKRDY